VTAVVPEPDRASLAEANRAIDLVSADPRLALALAVGLLDGHGLAAEERAVAERAAALAEIELGQISGARARFERARDRALADGLYDRVAEIQIGLAIVLLDCEEPEAAMAEIDSALGHALDVATIGKVQSQRATILMRLGRYGEALEQAAVALATCRSAGLLGPVARLLSNRGIVHAYLGDYGEAESELGEALELLRREGSDLGAANVVHNLGFVAARRGDVPSALARFDEAFAEYLRLDIPSHAAFTDRCEVLLSARLLPEARVAADAAVVGLERTGRAADLAEARLMLAEVALAGGDNDTAATQAGQAAEALERQGRSGWAALARFAAARARWARAPESPDRAAVVLEAEELAVELAAAGWRVQAMEARITAARTAIEAGDHVRAQVLLAAAEPEKAARGGPSFDERIRGWYAVALGRLAAGERSGALQALQAGLRIAEEHQATLGATELRARSALRAADLAELGLRLCLEDGVAADVLEWSERWRARSLRPPEVLPPPDELLAERLSQLRHTVAALELSVQAGESATPEVADLVRRRHQLETAIRHRSLQAGRQRRSPRIVPSLVELQAHLSGSASAAVVELVAIGGQLHAVVCTDRSCVVRELAPVGELERWRAALGFGLRRLVAGRSSPASLSAAAELVVRAAQAADDLLLGPIEGDLDAAFTQRRPELVIVPTGSLHSLPWGLLPRLAGRPVSIAPSAAAFLDRSKAAVRGGPTVLVAAPGVPSALAEVEGIARLYRGAVTLAGRAATAVAVAGVMSGAGTAHIVAHGTFRTDNPLFSALEVADGPLTVYELEEMGDPPELLVLSSCDTGRSDVRPGDELMGTAATMLSLGSRAIVASVVPMADAGAPAVMMAFHERLLAGHPPATALCLVQSEYRLGAVPAAELAGRSAPAQRALAAAGLICLGAGGLPPDPPRRPSEVPAEARMRGARVAAKMTK
jgi:tetratricopeptide (TPR) repeat protein